MIVIDVEEPMNNKLLYAAMALFCMSNATVEECTEMPQYEQKSYVVMDVPFLYTICPEYLKDSVFEAVEKHLGKILKTELHEEKNLYAFCFHGNDFSIVVGLDSDKDCCYFTLINTKEANQEKIRYVKKDITEVLSR